MYTVNSDILKKYAQVMVHFALNGGEGIKKNETVWINGQECSKDLILAISDEVHRSGGNVILHYLPNEIGRSGLNRSLLEIGSNEQISFFPKSYWQGITDSADHLLFVLASPNIHHMEGISSEKISLFNTAQSPFGTMRSKKECTDGLGWTLCLYGTQSMAQEAAISIEEYWEQIIEACYLREDDPVAKWKQTQKELHGVRDCLSNMKIKKIHIVGNDVDLTVHIGSDRKWLAGRGKNIPSFEVFTSPDWRGTNGWIRFNQPLYYSGKKISGIYLKFEGGIVVEATATENENLLHAMITNKNADKVGEFSLTDRRHSRITKFMAHTLYDENMGGEFGNTHIALGSYFPESYVGDHSCVSEQTFMGFNISSVHTDIISTTDRTATAILYDGTEVIIYKDGQFTFL